MCFSHLEMDNLTLFSKSMTTFLTCISLLREILYPCVSMKYLDHSILAMTLSIATISPSGEIFPFIYFLWRNWTPLTLLGTSWPQCVLDSLYAPRTNLIPTISPLSCHQHLRWVSFLSFPWGISTLASFPPSHPHLVYSWAQWVMSLMFVCICMPWQSLT